MSLSAITVAVKEYSDADSGRWDDYVLRTREATFCHLSGWIRVVCNTWGHRSFCLYAERGGEITGVLPLFLVKGGIPGLFYGSMLVSSPNAVYGGVLGDDQATYQLLIQRAREIAIEQKVDYLELRQTAEADFKDDDATSDTVGLYVTFESAIAVDDGDRMRGYPGDVRRMIRIGMAAGLYAVRGGEELLDEFYEVYASSVRNLGTPVFPKRLFLEFLRAFPESCDILAVRQARGGGGRPAGAVMSFYFRDCVMPYYAGAYPEFHRAGINNFMYSELMRLSAGRGYTRFDFGRSKKGTGSYRFKRGWKMNEKQLNYRCFHFGGGKAPEINPLNPKFRVFIEAWKRLPLSLTKLIGPRIVKYLP